MGREIRRVPVDFNHPVGQTWPGFLNPYSPKDCPACGGTGLSPAAKRYQDEWYGHVPFDPRSTGSRPFGPAHPAVVASAYYRGPRAAEIAREAARLAEHFDSHWMYHLSQADVDALVEADRLHEFTSVFVPGEGWKPKDPPYRPTAEEVNVWSIRGGIGHDSIYCWVCVKARCRRNGEPDRCAICDGDGTDPADAETQRLCEKWQKTDPPAGDAYQLWETVSEGSPITPAFADPAELARWCVAHQFDDEKLTRMNGRPWNRLAGGEEALTVDQWLRFITGVGSAVSAVSSPEKGFQSGVAAAVSE